MVPASGFRLPASGKCRTL